MDFGALITKINAESFSSNKKDVLKSYTGYLSASETVQVINAFVHASDKVEALTIMQSRIGVLSGLDGKMIVEAFTFDKLKVVEIIASHINDQANKYALLDAISFHFDKEKARKILDDTKPLSPPQGCYPCQQGSFPPPQGNFPPPQGSYPPPQQGNYPPPPQSNYPPPPQGNYPPAGGYPPPQGSYPPPQQGAYPPPPGTHSYPPQQGGYPPPPQGAGYPPPPQGTGYPPPPPYGGGSGYPAPGYPPQQQGFGF